MSSSLSRNKLYALGNRIRPNDYKKFAAKVEADGRVSSINIKTDNPRNVIDKTINLVHRNNRLHSRKQRGKRNFTNKFARNAIRVMQVLTTALLVYGIYQYVNKSSPIPGPPSPIPGPPSPIPGPSSLTPGPPSPTPGPNTDADTKACHELIRIQINTFPKILQELNKYNEKRTHWIWWVFPTELPGRNELQYSGAKIPTYVTKGTAKTLLLSSARTTEWKGILQVVCDLSKKYGFNKVFPAVKDRGRIGYFITFWTNLACSPQWLKKTCKCLKQCSKSTTPSTSVPSPLVVPPQAFGRWVITGPRSSHLDLKPAGLGNTSSLSPSNARKALYAQCKPYSSCVSLTRRSYSSGVAKAGWHLYKQDTNRRVGVMVAGNSGRPAGAVGGQYRLVLGKIHHKHKTQEEDIISGWLIAECGKNNVQKQNSVYMSTICGKWGMIQPNSTSVKTIQGVDYTNGTDPMMYADAWTVRNAKLCEKSNDFVTRNQYPATLVFVAGPNAGAKGTPRGSMVRTLNKHAERDYNFFENGVAYAIRTGLDAMVYEGVTVALIAKVSCGIYAGVHKKKINQRLPTLLQKILQEPVGPRGEKRGRYLKMAVLVDL